MVELISKPEFIQATHLERLHLQGMAKPLMKLTGLSRINALYDALYDQPGLAFIEGLFDKLGVEMVLDEEELKRIPKSGPFIAVCNHPFGMLDGLMLIHLLASCRPEAKVMANFLLQHIEPIRDYFIGVNPFENRPGVYSNLKGMKQALGHIRSGHPLGIFPAGEVSTYYLRQGKVSDRIWQPAVLKLIHKAGVPVVPVYFQGSNSLMFHLMGLVHPSLRTAALPSEFLKKAHARVRIRIGQPVPVREQEAFRDAAHLGRYLRARTYSLGSCLKVKPFFSPEQQAVAAPPLAPVAEARPAHLIEEEIGSIRPRCLRFSQQQFDVFICTAEEIPHILPEIGRLREVTFREVGEGTGMACDLDEYDLYYRHLFVWDREARCLVGAYRLGMGDQILRHYGKKGFYIHSLFKIQEPFQDYLAQSVELGRSFVVKKYQRHRLSLFLLWQGITDFLQEHPQYRYLTGPVSISNAYSKLSRRFMVAFIRKYYFDHQLAKWVKPRKKFRSKMADKALHELLEDLPNDLKTVDQVIADIEPAHFKLPVLLKKYIKKNARIIGFNLDPKFNNALDGLMLLDLKDLPEGTLEQYRPGEEG